MPTHPTPRITADPDGRIRAEIELRPGVRVTVWGDDELECRARLAAVVERTK
jgi:hypothetical protein